MAVNSIIPPYPSFFDVAGIPLEDGYIYVGQPGLEAQSSPKASYFDFALTIPTGTDTGAAVRTLAGFPVRAGAAAMIYVDGDFSITVLDRNGLLLYSALNRTFAFGSVAAGGLPVQAPDGNFGVTGFGFLDEVNTGFVRQGAGVVQSVILGNVISQQTASGTQFLLPVSGSGFVSGVAAALDTDLQQIAGIAAVEGDTLYRTATTWARLPVGAAGKVLRRNDLITPNIAPAWDDGIVMRPSQATAAGTAFDFNSIPAWVNRINVMGGSISLSGTDIPIVQLGTAGAFISAGYVSSISTISGATSNTTSSTAGFAAGWTVAAENQTFHMTLTRLGSGSNIWICAVNGVRTVSGANTTGAGTIDLGAQLTRVRVTRSGADTFDGGAVAISYE